MEHARSSGLVVASGSTDPAFTDRVCKNLEIQPAQVERRKFSNGELFVKYEHSLRGKDVFVIQTHDGKSTEYQEWSINDAIQEQIFMIDAAAGASANHVTAVCPNFGYARQDKKDDGRVAIAARRIARQLVGAGADLVISMDLHNAAIQGFTDNESFENLYGAAVLLKRGNQIVEERGQDNVVAVAADVGGVKRVAYWADRLGIDMAVIHKERSTDSKRVRAMEIIGDVTGKHCLVIEDMIDTGKTLSASVQALKQARVASVYAIATHLIFSGSASTYLRDTFDGIVGTDTVPLKPEHQRMKELEVVTVTGVFAEAIGRVHREESVSDMFDRQVIDF